MRKLQHDRVLTRPWLRVWVVVAIAACSFLAAGTTQAAKRADASPFAFRGVIQGSYGPTWSHEDRMDAVRWMGAHGLNAYVHAPKNDGYQRIAWREPYPAVDQAAFAEEISLGRRLGVDWIPNVSPGFPLIPSPTAPPAAPSTDICFSCPADLDTLVAKIQPFIDAGATSAMVSFDDVQKVSSHPEDAAAYGTGPAAYGHMNRDLLNAVHRHFVAAHPDFRLFTVLAEYSGTADSDYLSAVRADGGIDDGIVVMWTGVAVVAPEIRTADAAAYAAVAGVERVAIWDNYPANDVPGNAAGATRRIFLGPYQGRATDLDAAASGIFINVMNEAWANRIVMGTLSRYLADPDGYSPEPAWQATILELAEGDVAVADALSALAENSRSSSLNRTESPIFTARAQALLDALEAGPFWTEAFDALQAEATREADAAALVRTRFPALAAQVGRFLDRLHQNASVIGLGAELLAAQRPTLHVSREGRVISGCAAPPSATTASRAAVELSGAHAATAASTADVHGDRATPALDNPTTFFGVYAGENRVDAFHAAVTDRFARWLTTAVPASSSVTLTVNDQPVTADGNGCFTFSSATPKSMVTVVATDGAGERTGRRL